MKWKQAILGNCVWFKRLDSQVEIRMESHFYGYELRLHLTDSSGTAIATIHDDIVLNAMTLRRAKRKATSRAKALMAEIRDLLAETTEGD